MKQNISITEKTIDKIIKKIKNHPDDFISWLQSKGIKKENVRVSDVIEFSYEKGLI